MSQSAFLAFGVFALALLGGMFLLRTLFSGSLMGGKSTGRSLRDLNEEYRERSGDLDDGDSDYDADLDPDDLERNEQLLKNERRKVTLEDRLLYAQLKGVPTYLVGVSQILTSLILFMIARRFLEEPLQVLALLLGPMIVNTVIDRRIRRRVARFDADFPQFLLAVVGMLKTGLNPVQALEAAVQNLEEDSLVKSEVELMLERFRVGVPEDRSIGSFGEDIAQPEIELFVQALILSRRVGGNLSETLDRLAKQVRKRHTFKMSANTAVAQQRGAIWVIVMIMVAVELFMLKSAPAMVIGAWTHPKLVDWSQGAVVLIFAGIKWIIRLLI